MVINEHRDCIDRDGKLPLNDIEDHKKMMKIFLNNEFDEDNLIFDFYNYEE